MSAKPHKFEGHYVIQETEHSLMKSQTTRVNIIWWNALYHIKLLGHTMWYVPFDSEDAYQWTPYPPKLLIPPTH